MTHRNRFIAPLAIVVALTLAPALGGCAILENVIENTTGGEVDLGGQSVPEGFPTEEVPLTEGEVMLGSSIKQDNQQVFNVAIKIDDVSRFDDIRTQLEEAGFTAEEGMGGATADGATGAFTSDAWTVLVVVANQEPVGAVANYTVTPVSN